MVTLHDLCSTRGGQGEDSAPLGNRSIERVRFCVPLPPHEALHSPQFDQVDTEQLTVRMHVSVRIKLKVKIKILR